MLVNNLVSLLVLLFKLPFTKDYQIKKASWSYQNVYVWLQSDPIKQLSLYIQEAMI